MTRLSLSRQLLLLQMLIVVLVVAAVAVTSLVQTDSLFRQSEARRLLASAETVANEQLFRSELAGDVEGLRIEALRSRMEAARSYTNASYVIVVNAHGTVVSHTGGYDGKPAFDFLASDVRGGGVWTGTLDRFERRTIEAHVPVLSNPPGGPPGDLVGYLILGKFNPSRLAILGTAATSVVLSLVVATLIGTAGSLLVSRRVKRQTLGLEPKEIAGLVDQREAMLHGVREGVVGVDTGGAVSFVNDEAKRLLDATLRHPVGRLVSSLEQPPDVVRILTGQAPESDRVVVVNGRLVVCNTRPIEVRGFRTGWVTSMRDRTELLGLQEALAASQRGTETLRAQVHEFRNRLHAIAGLAEMGHKDELLAFVHEASDSIDARTADVTDRIADPAVAALLIAKSSRARELQIDFKLESSARLHRHGISLCADLVTVLGNLIDNAFEALIPHGGEVLVGIHDTGETIEIFVSDSGTGFAPENLPAVFEAGFTSKSDRTGHGWGLALTKMACQRNSGDVYIESGNGATVRAIMGDPEWNTRRNEQPL